MALEKIETLTCKTTGRFVKIELQGKNFLNLCEVKVMGSKYQIHQLTNYSIKSIKKNIFHGMISFVLLMILISKMI